MTWHVYVESGSPPPFKDFHVRLTVGEPSFYESPEMPPGWRKRIAVVVEPLQYWLSFYGDSAVTDAVFGLTFTVKGDSASGLEWRLTADGDYDPTTGLIPGEGGFDAVVPRHVGVNDYAKVAVHVLPHDDTRTCVRSFPDIQFCDDIVSTCQANDVDFFPVFYDLVEYSSIVYGVDWPGSYSCIFWSCSPLTIGTIVWPAGSVPEGELTDEVHHGWTSCQPGPIAIPGWGWLYEDQPAEICIVPREAGGNISIADCIQGPNPPICSFCGGFAGASGEDPCGPSAAREGTWGEIKAIFR
jgi:hypothetical protein